MKVIISKSNHFLFIPENDTPFKQILTTNTLYKITNGEAIGAYGDLYVIEQLETCNGGEIIGLNIVQSYDSRKIKILYDDICKNHDVLDTKFIL